MLDPEFKTKWVDALRSDEFQQGRYALCDSGHFCCLGVAARLLDPEAEWDNLAFTTNVYEGGRPDWLSTDQINYLIHLNDEKRFGFNQIADYIEANL